MIKNWILTGVKYIGSYAVYVIIMILTLMGLVTAVQSFTGPSYYEECMLEKLHGKPDSARYFANALCEDLPEYPSGRKKDG